MYTIDMLIKRLEQIKKFHGKNIPIRIFNEHGGLTGVVSVIVGPHKDEGKVVLIN